MRILAIHNYYQIRSGEDLAFDATVAAMERHGHEVRCVTADNRVLAGGAMKLPRLACLPFTTVFSISSFARVVRAVRDFKPDVALVQNVFPLLSPSVYAALRVTGVPVAQRLFNYRLVCPNGILFTKGEICERCVSGSYVNAVRHACYRDSRAQSAVLAFSLRSWRSLGVWDWGVSVFLTPDRFLGDKVSPAMRDASRIRVLFNPSPEQAGLVAVPRAPRGRDVLFVGRLVREKGIFTFIECAAQAPDVQFFVVGKGRDEEEARRLAASHKLGNLTWLGAVYGEPLDQLLQRAGALVVPSQWYDNMPLVLTQALLAGVPVVASRIDGIPEFILDGETGRLAVPGDAASFTSQLQKVFDEPELTRTMATEGMRRAREWFGNDQFAHKLEEILGTIRRNDASELPG